jgi:hypothetical protein
VFGRKTILARLTMQRFFVTLTANEGSFWGVLIDADDSTFVFDDVWLATPEGRQKAEGRTYLDRISVAYFQEVTGG